MDIAVDYPDEVIHWFACYPDAGRVRKVVGPCSHDCPHNMTATVGWGPDYVRYELHECTVRDGCNRNCRGWMAATGATSYELHRAIRWQELAPADAPS